MSSGRRGLATTPNNHRGWVGSNASPVHETPPSPDRLDGVPPPAGQGPVLVVWRRNGNRKKRIRGKVGVVVMYIVLYFVFLAVSYNTDHGWWPGTSTFIITLFMAATAAFLQQWTQFSGRVFVAAGPDWVGWGTNRRAKNPVGVPAAWVNLNTLEQVRTKVRHQYATRSIEFTFKDVAGHSVVLDSEALTSCEPLMKLVGSAVHTVRASAQVDDTALRFFHQAHVRPFGQTVLRK